jgi:beta-glucanase (GH16 family)
MWKYWYLGLSVVAIFWSSIYFAPASYEGGLYYDKPGWLLIFDDEFNGTTLNTARWDTCYPWVDHSNCNLADSNELEVYQSDEAYLDGAGHLILRTQKKTVNGFNYTSGMVDTYYSFSFTYGYVEARLKVPAGKGLWPTFWILPANDGPWPVDEIDVMENLGQDPTTAYFTYHWPSGGTTLLSQYHYTGPDFSADWHIFAVDWEPDAIIWYVDGVERARYTDASNITSKPMFVIVNLAVGGDWPGSPDDTTPFPNYYQVDYVRVWKKVTSQLYLPFIERK